VFKRFRIAILLYILAFVAIGEFLASRRATDWNDTLWVDVYLVNGSVSEATRGYLERLPPDAFEPVERFFSEQAGDFGVDIDAPFRLRVAGPLGDELPPVPENGLLVSSVIWSLRMRWFVTRLHWSSDSPTPDITLFAIYHEAESGVALDRSTALRKGRIAVANLFASHNARGSNQMVIAHEILHTLGATDKYDPASGLPVFPYGFANPVRSPLYPQSKAELMAGRIAVSQHEAAIPGSLAATVIGPGTAAEIGWIVGLGATD
jgi:hypothetical protein